MDRNLDPPVRQNLRQTPDDRLFAQAPSSARIERIQFAALLVFWFCIHLGGVAALVTGGGVPAPGDSEEIPVEIIAEPAQQPQPPAPAAKPPEPEKPVPKPPPKPLRQLDLKPAFDAPKAASKDKTERDSDDEATKAQKIAPPPEKASPAPDPKPQSAQSAQPPAASENASAPQATAKRLDEDKPDAEIITKAESEQTKTGTTPSDKASDKPESKDKQPVSKKAQSLADQFASFEAVPDYKLGGAAKLSPVGGGHAKTTYFTILYGLIMPKFRKPPGLQSSEHGEIQFAVDERGVLMYVGVVNSCGVKDIDDAALIAVRKASPFPPPPDRLRTGITFTY